MNMVEPPYYEVTVRLPLDLYDETWFDKVADAAGDKAAVSGSIIPGPPSDDLTMCLCGLAMYAIDGPEGWIYVCEDCDPELMQQVR